MTVHVQLWAVIVSVLMVGAFVYAWIVENRHAGYSSRFGDCLILAAATIGSLVVYIAHIWGWL